MAKTLKTGDVKRYPNYGNKVLVVDKHRWVTLCEQASNNMFGFITREQARKDASILARNGYMARIAKIIKRGPKFIFVEVSK